MISAGKKIIIVSGFPRCGSTMMMRMLYAGGLDTIGNKVAFEDNRATFIGKKDYWLSEAQGKAIKILDMHRQVLPDEFEYKIIWMKRNYTEQGKSNVKLLRMMAKIDVPNMAYKKFADSYPAEEKRFLQKMKERNIEYAIFEFEKILNNPILYSLSIRDFLELEQLDWAKMAGIVKMRDPKCAEGIDQEISYLNNNS